jgi:putative membrane protein
MAERERILVLNVDRDDDLGRKAGIKGPVIGREDVLKAATALAVADPEESDANAMFGAVRLFDEASRGHAAEVAVLTGGKDVGLASDRVIAGQLTRVLRRFKADYAVFVTDGAEDEYVLPIIQSRVPIMSVRKVVVRQAEQLESAYFKMRDFVKESFENPKMSRLVFGLPAVILLMYALLGIDGWRFALGIIGAYMFIKGFGLDDYVLGAMDEFKTSLVGRKSAFFAYVVGFAFAAYATYRGYTIGTEFVGRGVFEPLASFVSASAFLYFMAGMMTWLGRGLNRGGLTRSKMVSVPLFGLAVALVGRNSAQLILSPEIYGLNFLLSIFTGFGMLFIALVLEWRY